MSYSGLPRPLVLTSFSVNYSKDVRLPVQLQRAMAAEAEAAREARAKVCMSAFLSVCLKYLSSHRDRPAIHI